jgi:hypothetical protein
MRPRFDAAGRLPPGIYWVTWQTLARSFGFSERRVVLLKGLRESLLRLKAAGCRTVYVDGSFVTAKREPADFDACWATQGVDPEKLDRVFLDFSDSRAGQKLRFGGEFFPVDLPEGRTGKVFLEFFQTDKETGERKGLVAVDLMRMRK